METIYLGELNGEPLFGKKPHPSLTEKIHVLQIVEGRD